MIHLPFVVNRSKQISLARPLRSLAVTENAEKRDFQKSLLCVSEGSTERPPLGFDYFENVNNISPNGENGKGLACSLVGP
jgi:hypothetical protein